MTDDELNKLVVERAKAQVAERQAAQQTVTVVEPRVLPRAERPMLWAFFGVLATALIGSLLLLPGTFVDRLGWIVHGVCAQEHKLLIGGIDMPLCQRNTGLYSGFLATVLTLIALGRGQAARLPKRSITLLLVLNVVWMGSDGFNSLFKDIGNYNLYEPQPILRILSGLAMGMTMGVMLLYTFNVSLRARPRRDLPVMGSWKDVAIVAAVELALFALIQLNATWLIYPLAIFSTVGILGVMFLVNLIVLAMFTRYEGGLERVRDLALPGIIAVVLTGAEFGLLAWVRTLVEQNIA